MSWLNGKLLTMEEATRRSKTTIPGRHQIGDAVRLHLQVGGGVTVEGFVVGAHFTAGQVGYDVAVQNDFGYYQVMPDIRSILTPIRRPHSPKPATDFAVNNLNANQRNFIESMQDTAVAGSHTRQTPALDTRKLNCVVPFLKVFEEPNELH